MLAPGGVAVFVTPNRLTFGRPDEIIDPYHCVEFDPRAAARALPRRRSPTSRSAGSSARRATSELWEAQRQSMERVLRLDVLGLRKRLSKRMLQRLYDASLHADAPRARRRCDITPEDFTLGDRVRRRRDGPRRDLPRLILQPPVEQTAQGWSFHGSGVPVAVARGRRRRLEVRSRGWPASEPGPTAGSSSSRRWVAFSKPGRSTSSQRQQRELEPEVGVLGLAVDRAQQLLARLDQAPTAFGDRRADEQRLDGQRVDLRRELAPAPRRCSSSSGSLASPACALADSAMRCATAGTDAPTRRAPSSTTASAPRAATAARPRALLAGRDRAQEGAAAAARPRARGEHAEEERAPAPVIAGDVPVPVEERRGPSSRRPPRPARCPSRARRRASVRQTRRAPASQQQREPAAAEQEPDEAGLGQELQRHVVRLGDRELVDAVADGGRSGTTRRRSRRPAGPTTRRPPPSTTPSGCPSSTTPGASGRTAGPPWSR